MAWAEVATAKTIATATNLISVPSIDLPMTHPIARTKPMGPALAFVHKRSAH
jgi:hypothetical protein